jgi:general secretion pathway protein L
LGRFSLDAAALAGLPAALRRRPRRVVLRPPPGTLLEREAVLPLAARHDPGGVLRYELDRLTPFAPEEVFWTWRQEGRDAARGTLRLRVSLLPKAALQAPIEALRRAGLQPAGLEAGGRRRRTRAIPVGEAAGAPSRRREAWRRRGLAAAGVACGGLAVAAVALPFVLQSFALAAADRHIEALRPRVAEAEALRRRMADAKGGQDAFAAERARVGDALRAIAALTEILPDDTWLTELTLRQRKLTMAGRSAGAARLIGLLSADPPSATPPSSRRSPGPSPAGWTCFPCARNSGCSVGPLDLPTGRRGRLLALGMTLAVLGALWAGVAAPLLDWHALRAEQVEARRALARRMAEIAETLPELRDQARLATAAGRAPGEATLDGASDAIAAAALQGGCKTWPRAPAPPCRARRRCPAKPPARGAASACAFR